MKTTGYAIAHFGVDLCCALVLFRHFPGHPQWMLALLLYNFCAFALQLPFGILADKLNRNHRLAATGMLLVAAAFLCTEQMPLSVILAGCGNGLFHVGGGIEVLNQSVHKAFRLGLFVAPGALGLFLGTRWGKSALLLWPAPLMLAVASILLFCLGRRITGNAPPLLPKLMPGLWALAGVVVLRSYLGFCMRFSWNDGFFTGLLIAAVTVAGKIAGGFLLDRLGYLPTALCSLLPAAVCLLFLQQMVPALLGLFFFQMTMPVTLWAAARCCPGAKGFSFGLLTFALFLGFLPAILGLPTPGNGTFLAGGILLSLLLLVLGRKCAL
ncbi:MAG: hypothetical protein IJ043_05080 [Clostridia bacterium]|nr:hypothetical protein [Clostridia bacterium]